MKQDGRSLAGAPDVERVSLPATHREVRAAAVKETLSAGSAAIISAIAVATSAAAPEFIWQGLQLVVTHLSWETLVSAVLVALLLVFFVEPILEQIRGWLNNDPATHRETNRHLAVAATVGFFIALVSVGLHDAMAAFAETDHPSGGLERAVTVTVSWGAVPFAVALAWQAAGHRILAIPVGLVAAASSVIAGWWFDWGVTTTVTTAIPCLLIQFLGYRRTGSGQAGDSFVRYAPTLAVVAIGWLLFTPLFDAVVALCRVGWPPLYAQADYLVDVRFYLGWFLGLLLTRPSGRTPARQDTAATVGE